MSFEGGVFHCVCVSVGVYPQKQKPEVHPDVVSNDRSQVADEGACDWPDLDPGDLERRHGAAFTFCVKLTASL